MKFSFIISVVIALTSCECAYADTRIFNDLKYLEDLNELDRRNVEDYDNLYKQWPWRRTESVSIDENERTEPEYEPDLNSENLMNIQDILDITRATLKNRHHPNYRGKVIDRLEDSFKHLKDTTDRVAMLSHFLLSNSPKTDPLEEPRVYPQEDDFTFNEEGEGNKIYRDINDFDIDDDEVIENGPSISESFYPPAKPLTTNNFHMHKSTRENHENHHEHEHEDYRFKEGEEFPFTSFKDIPLADDPTEFGYGPSDPRFYEKHTKTGTKLFKTGKPLQQPQQPAQTQESSKLRMISRSDPQKQTERLPEDDFVFGSKAKSSEGDVEVVAVQPEISQADTAGVYIIAVVAGISAAATVGLIAVGIGWYNLQKHMKNAEETDYPSYGIVGPNKDYEKKEREEAGDRRLAQSAQMYHYQHQKQQIIAMGRNPPGGHGSQSDTEEEEDEEGNYTVYECPGLASIEGPLEVKNPMFDDDQLATPSQTPSKSTNAEDPK